MSHVQKKKKIISSGPKCALALLRIILEAKKFQLKTTVVGHHASEPREGRVPKGIIRSTAEGCEYEGDQRLVMLMVQELNLTSQTPCSFLGKTRKKEEEELSVSLDKDEAPGHR